MELEQIKKAIEEMCSLPTIPAMIGKISYVTKDLEDENAFEKLHYIISHDQAIAERVLRIANSPFFGHAGQIHNLRQAIMFLGFENIRNIALSMSIFSYFTSKTKITLLHFWKHTYEVALISSRLAKQLGFLNEGIAFLEGLLHDIGRLLFLTINGKEYFKIFNEKNLLEYEIKLFGCNHCEVGMVIAEKGQLPENFKEVIYYHHNPLDAKEYKMEVIIVSLADAIMSRISPSLGCDSHISDDELKKYLNRANIDENILEDLVIFYNENKESIEIFYK